MPKRLIKRIIPDHELIRSYKYLRIFGSLLHDPRLWHLNRRSAAGAFAVGLFMAFVPVPFQMLLATGGAILARVNLPLSVALVWLTNPITMPPIFYFCYLVGAALLGHPIQPFHFSLAGEGLLAGLKGIWPAFLLGCLVCGAASSLLGYLGIHAFWRWRVIRRLRRRRARQPSTLPPHLGNGG
jgi:uncharacterized protein